MLKLNKGTKSQQEKNHKEANQKGLGRVQTDAETRKKRKKMTTVLDPV